MTESLTNINNILECADGYSLEFLESHQCFPLEKTSESLTIGISNKDYLNEIVKYFKENSNLKVKAVKISEDKFKQLLSSCKANNKAKKVMEAKAAKGSPPKRLGEQLIDEGLITKEDLVKALADAKQYNLPIGSALVEFGYITVEQLRASLSKQQGVEFININQLKMEKKLLDLLPESFIRANKTIPISNDGKTLVVGMVNPGDKKVLDEIIYLTGLKPSPFLITHIEFNKFITKYFKTKSQANKIIAAISEDEGEDSADNVWSQVEKELKDNSSMVAQFANQIITDAIETKASDIHIEPRLDGYIVRYRTDGILKKVLDIPEKVESALISRFKVVSRMNIAEHRRAQDGTFSVMYNGISYDLRINTLPVGNHEKMVIRVLQPSATLSDKKEEIKLVGATSEDMRKIDIMTAAPSGIILTSGPTGSGKTTTLYSVLKKVNEESINISTIEDPVEIRLDGVNQTQVNPKADITFATCIRALLRQDPDVILIGEIRDFETLEAAISASLTGHLVLSTIHTNSAAATITRLIEMGAKDYLISSTLSGVIAQRLVRKLCPHCKEVYTPDKVTEVERIIPQKEEQDKFLEQKIYTKKGCEKCKYTGYLGRLGVYEIMLINKEIKKLIAQGAPDVDIEDVAVSCGMKTLNQSCLSHILAGETTIEEFIRVLGVVCE